MLYWIKTYFQTAVWIGHIISTSRTLTSFKFIKSVRSLFLLIKLMNVTNISPYSAFQFCDQKYFEHSIHYHHDEKTYMYGSDINPISSEKRIKYPPTNYIQQKASVQTSQKKKLYGEVVSLCTLGSFLVIVPSRFELAKLRVTGQSWKTRTVSV